MVFMKRHTVITQRRRGPAPTGKGTLVGVRLQPPQLSALDAWIKKQDAPLTRPEAIRAMMETILHILSKDTGEKPARNAGRSSRAAELAAKAMGDPTAPPEERAQQTPAHQGPDRVSRGPRRSAEREAMSEQKRSAEEQIADEADRKARNPTAARQKISEGQAAPEFQQNRERLKAERLAREAELKTKK